MKTFSFPAVMQTSSKRDEVEALRAVAALFPAGTYLSHLFSPQLVQWAVDQIANDFAPDIHAALAAQRAETTKAHDEIVSLRLEILRLNREIARLKTDR